MSSQIDNLEEVDEFEAIAQLRHRHQGNRVFIKKLEDGSAQLRFIDEWTTVSPGQIAAIYGLDNQKLLGGGRILAPLV